MGSWRGKGRHLPARAPQCRALPGHGKGRLAAAPRAASHRLGRRLLPEVGVASCSCWPPDGSRGPHTAAAHSEPLKKSLRHILKFSFPCGRLGTFFVLICELGCQFPSNQKKNRYIFYLSVWGLTSNRSPCCLNPRWLLCLVLYTVSVS